MNLSLSFCFVDVTVVHTFAGGVTFGVLESHAIEGLPRIGDFANFVNFCQKMAKKASRGAPRGAGGQAGGSMAVDLVT